MKKFDFIAEMIKSFSPKTDPAKKKKYINQINGFVLSCPEEHLQKILDYAHSVDGYPAVKDLIAYAKKAGLFGSDDKIVQLPVWTCDHGGIGSSSVITGSYCFKCGDKIPNSAGY